MILASSAWDRSSGGHPVSTNNNRRQPKRLRIAWCTPIVRRPIHAPLTISPIGVQSRQNRNLTKLFAGSFRQYRYRQAGAVVFEFISSGLGVHEVLREQKSGAPCRFVSLAPIPLVFANSVVWPMILVYLNGRSLGRLGETYENEPVDASVSRGTPMQLRRSISILKPLFFLCTVLPAVHPSVASPQSQENAASPASLSSLKSNAEAGDAVAQYKLAQVYLRSNPAAPDYSSAIKWLRASASQGNDNAEFMLGYLFEHGQGLPKDYAKAAENYEAAARQGHSSAANNLASLYQNGQGVPKNLGKAFEWYLAAALAANPVGQCNLATMYYFGEGTRRDYALAVKWFRAAADLGEPSAQHDLAVLYYKGLGVSSDYTEAARWERLAAQQGQPHAETDLAYLYELGKGVPLDYVAAYTWYSRAIAAGDNSGVQRRKDLSRLMTSKQLGEAAALISGQSSQPPPGSAYSVADAFTLLEFH